MTPIKVFEVLFGNNFERIRKDTERYDQRLGKSDLSVSLAEVKCAAGILILTGTTGFQVEEIIGNKNQIC